MRQLPGFWDGDTGPTYRFQCKDAGAVVDLSSVAVEIYVHDEADGSLLARRVGLPVSPKSTGFFDVTLLGRETDWDGLGKRLILKPKIYAAVSPTGAAATNLLANPSFDTDGDANGIADSWTLQGAKTATWSVLSDDPWPVAIFGNTQQVKHASLADPDYFLQTAAATINAGDRYSFGVWHRSNGTGGTPADTHAVFAHLGANANTVVRFSVGTNDWYFLTGSMVATQAETSWTLGMDFRGTTLDNRLDDAFLFKGDWRTLPVEPLLLPLHGRARVSKNLNQIAGIGDFLWDSNADGLADGLSKQNASGVTFAMEYNPTNFFIGSSSQKVTLAGFTGKFLRYLHRGRYNVNDVWRASVRVKTNGALTGSPTNGQWAIVLSTDDFGDGAPQQSGTTTNFGTNVSSFTLYSSDITIATLVGTLRVDLFLNGVTGSAWFDDLQLLRVTP